MIRFNPPPAIDDSRLRRAFTLVELLVVITIIGILIALLLPAVQAAHERHNACSAATISSRAILASHNFNEAKGMFTMGLRNRTPPDLMSGGPVIGWDIDIMPYMEYGSVYNLTGAEYPSRPSARGLVREQRPRRPDGNPRLSVSFRHARLFRGLAFRWCKPGLGRGQTISLLTR